MAILIGRSCWTPLNRFAVRPPSTHLQLVGGEHRHEAGRRVDDLDVDVEPGFLEIAALLGADARRRSPSSASVPILMCGLRRRGERPDGNSQRESNNNSNKHERPQFRAQAWLSHCRLHPHSNFRFGGGSRRRATSWFRSRSCATNSSDVLPTVSGRHRAEFLLHVGQSHDAGELRLQVS